MEDWNDERGVVIAADIIDELGLKNCRNTNCNHRSVMNYLFYVSIVGQSSLRNSGWSCRPGRRRTGTT